MASAVSVRGQTVIPRWIRETFHIDFKTRLEWSVVDGRIVVLPVSGNPIKDAWGMLKDTNVSTQELLKAHREERDLERRRHQALGGR